MNVSVELSRQKTYRHKTNPILVVDIMRNEHQRHPRNVLKEVLHILDLQRLEPRIRLRQVWRTAESLRCRHRRDFRTRGRRVGTDSSRNLRSRVCGTRSGSSIPRASGRVPCGGVATWRGCPIWRRRSRTANWTAFHDMPGGVNTWDSPSSLVRCFKFHAPRISLPLRYRTWYLSPLDFHPSVPPL